MHCITHTHTHMQTNTHTHIHTYAHKHTRTTGAHTQCAGKKWSHTLHKPWKPPQGTRSTAPYPPGLQTEVDTINLLHSRLKAQCIGADLRCPEEAAGWWHEYVIYILLDGTRANCTDGLKPHAKLFIKYISIVYIAHPLSYESFENDFFFDVPHSMGAIFHQIVLKTIPWCTPDPDLSIDTSHDIIRWSWKMLFLSF